MSELYLCRNPRVFKAVLRYVHLSYVEKCHFWYKFSSNTCDKCKQIVNGVKTIYTFMNYILRKHNQGWHVFGLKNRT